MSPRERQRNQFAQTIHPLPARTSIVALTIIACRLRPLTAQDQLRCTAACSYGLFLSPRIALWHETLEFRQFDAAANNKRRALMNAVGLNVKNAPRSIECRAARLFGQERNWIGFVKQTQLSVWVGFGRWIKKHSAY